MTEALVAIISDIHSNLPALDAVLRECERRNIGHYLCLGDIVGYGAQPAECLSRIRELDCVTLLGNHDWAVATGAPSPETSPLAVAGMRFSIAQLSLEARQWLGALPATAEKYDATFVHASLMDPLSWNYVLSQQDADLSMYFQETALSFCGHTHVPGIFVESGSEPPRELDDLLYGFSKNSRALINAGSVGQPRNDDPRAQFVVWDSEKFQAEFVRVDYDVPAAVESILSAGLPEMLAYRLVFGT